jgi:hypothetical protein
MMNELHDEEILEVDSQATAKEDRSAAKLLYRRIGIERWQGGKWQVWRQ